MVIEMTCTSEQEAIQPIEQLELIECEEKIVSEQIAGYNEDEGSRKLRKHLAQQKALRQLEQTKSRVLAATHRMSFIR